MKAAYVTQYDAQDIRSWSGTGYNLARSLQESGLELNFIGPLKNTVNPWNVARYVLHTKLRGKNDHPQRDPGFLRNYARQAEALLARSDADVIVAPGGLPLSYLKTELPIVLWTDCTFANLINYYPAFSDLSDRSIRNGHDCERRALHNCDLLLFSSRWAADSAISDYGVDPARVHVVPLGSNMPDSRSKVDVDRLVSARVTRLSQRITLFTSGVSWHRKGIDIAVEVLKSLNERGIEAELIVAGCHPPPGTTLPDNVRLLGFIPKDSQQGLEQLIEIYSSAHFFLLATRADCTPMVLAEAGSFGLPCLAADTGGIASMVQDGVNGWIFNPSRNASEWADRIIEVISLPDDYAKLCRSSYEHYRKNLTWARAGEKAFTLIRGLVEGRRVWI